MKTNVERLVDALRQVDDREYVRHEYGDLVLDGTWEDEPLEGALATAFAPEPVENQIAFTLEPADPQSLFLRTVWATGTTGSGREFEVAQSGVTLILSLGKFTGDDRIVDKVMIDDLVKAWLTLRGER